MIEHKFIRKDSATRENLEDVIAFDTKTAEFIYRNERIDLTQTTTAINHTVRSDENANKYRTNRMKRKGGIV